MSDEPIIENEQDLVKKIEQPQSNIESKAEEAEASLVAGAQMLETPSDGNFLSALKIFSDWVMNLLGKK